MSDEEWFAYDEESLSEEFYCRDCGEGGLLCKCNSDDDPRDYNPESDSRKYDQGGEG